MTLIDSHAHLTFDVLRKELDAVLARARDAGVEQVITVGTNVDDSRRAIELANAHGGVSATVGVHPHEAAKVADADLTALGTLLDAPRVVALGEIGLDYHYDFSDRASQRRVFEAQLALGAECGLPLVIHSRDAVVETCDMLSAAGFDDRPVVFHCFTGSADEAGRIARHGWRISFTGIVTFKRSAELQAIARAYPADKLMLETDSPYVSPEPVRKIRTNEPAHLVHTARFLADLRDEPSDVLAEQTTANARAFFGLAGC